MTELEKLCSEWLDKHKVTSYIAEDNGRKYFKCGKYNKADADNLVVEIAKLLEK